MTVKTDIHFINSEKLTDANVEEQIRKWMVSSSVQDSDNVA